MNPVHTYLFLLDDGNISRYQVNEKTGVYSLLKYNNDEKSQPFSDHFWDDWIYDTSYIEGDEADFAFLSDDAGFKFTGHKKFLNLNSTKYFTTGKIRQFMKDNLEYYDLSFVFNGREIKIDNFKPEYKGPKKFYLSIPYPSNDETVNYPEPSNNDFSLGDYFKKVAQGWDENCGK